MDHLVGTSQRGRPRVVAVVMMYVACSDASAGKVGDMMRRAFSAVCFPFIGLATVAVSWTSGEAEDYKYPYRDPYLATVTTAILNADRLSPRLKRQVVHVPGLPGRNRLPALEGRGNVTVALYRQDHPAPLVFILSGIGSNPYFGLATYYATLFHQEGSHVVILPSPMSWNFALAGSRSGAPGYAPEDARDLYEAMQKVLSVLRTRYAVNITGINFMGTSLGALEGAYLSVIDAEQQRIGIGKYLLVNPPLDLGRALTKVDEWHALAARFGAERAKGIVAKALNIVDSFSKDRRDDPAIFDSAARDFASFTREELQFLIAEDLQAALPELIYVAQIVHEQTTRPAAKDQARKRLQELKDMSLASYREKIALPLWRLQLAEPQADLDSLIKRGSLASILDRLRGRSNVHIMHNADDFLADRRSIEELKELLGDQMTLYPYGGHLGNLWYPENRESILRFFSTVSGAERRGDRPLSVPVAHGLRVEACGSAHYDADHRWTRSAERGDRAIELEKRGVPTVTIVTEEFRGLYGIVTTSLGQPSLPAVYVPHPIVSVPHPEMRGRAEPVMAAIVEIASDTGARGNRATGSQNPGCSSRPGAATDIAERITVEDDPEAIFERFAREDWTDGLPIVPPTEARVAQMLAGSDLDPSLSLGPMPPRWGAATIGGHRHRRGGWRGESLGLDPRLVLALGHGADHPCRR
jgi:hypothetical protein